MGNKKSESEEQISEWMDRIGSETLEQRLAFRNWMRWNGWWSLDDKNKEIIKQGWLPVIRGEYKKYH